MFGAMSTTAKVPEEPGLRHLAKTLEANGAVAQLSERKWRFVYYPSEVQRMMALPDQAITDFMGISMSVRAERFFKLVWGIQNAVVGEKSLRSWTSRSFATSFAWRERPISLGARRSRAVRRTRIHLHGHERYLRDSCGSSEYSSTGGIHADRGRARVELARAHNLAQGRVPCRPRDDGTDGDGAVSNSRGERVLLTDIAGARFVSQGDARILEQVAT